MRIILIYIFMICHGQHRRDRQCGGSVAEDVRPVHHELAGPISGLDRKTPMISSLLAGLVEVQTIYPQLE